MSYILRFLYLCSDLILILDCQLLSINKFIATFSEISDKKINRNCFSFDPKNYSDKELEQETCLLCTLKFLLKIVLELHF